MQVNTFLLLKKMVKAKRSGYRPGVAQRVGRGIALLFHDRFTRRGEWSAARPGRTLPPGKTRYPFYRRLGGPEGRSGRAEYLVPYRIRSRTVQTVDHSLYRLSYRVHCYLRIYPKNVSEVHRIYLLPAAKPPPSIGKWQYEKTVT